MAAVDVEGAKLFVLGKTRVGKGEFIQTAVHSLTGEVLNIASERMISHTKCATGYSVTLNGKTVELVDTVGYDDSNGDDTCETEFLKLLSNTGTAPFYPPLVVLREMAGSDIVWLKKIRSVFPSVVCAVRCKKKAFVAAQKDLAGTEFAEALFHLHEFIDEEDDGGFSRKLYLDDVMKICGFYGRHMPTREKLDFDASVFHGVFDYVKIRSETKAEDRVETVFITKEDDVVVTNQKIVTVEDGGHYIDKEVRRDDWERWIEGVKTFFILGAGGWAETKTIKEWVKDTKEIAVDNSTIEQVKVNLIERSKIRLTFQRNHYEVWKVLTGGIKVFKEYAESDWEEIKKDVIEVTQTRLRDQPETSQ